MKSVPTVSLLLALMAGLAAPARADELGDQGREVFQKHQRTVVTVEIVLKTKYSLPGLGSQDNESKQNLTGTVVDPSGLTVLSLSATDPGGLMQRLMTGMAGDEEDAKIKFETELADVKILLDDGSELAAEVALRDKDLDLVFVRPKTKPAAPMAAVDLGSAASARVLDHVITLNRLGPAAGRAYAVSIGRIAAVVQKPRLFYLLENGDTPTALGAPAFTPDGKLLGVFVMRSLSAKGGGGLGAMFSLQAEGPTAIILPAADIRKGAQQAAESKGEAAKPAAAKEEK
jgi:hypothetical protein